MLNGLGGRGLLGRFFHALNQERDPRGQGIRPASLEALEPRTLLSGVSALDQLVAASGGRLQVDPALPLASIAPLPPAPNAALAPLTSVPALSSLPGAHAKIYLDFNGDSTLSWGDFTPGTTPAFSQDADATTFSDSELASIAQIWRRVAEKFSPFNINVTTVDPGNLTNLESLKVVIGGAGDWLGAPAGGVAYLDSFNSADATYGNNLVWVFTDNLANGDVVATAEASAHEAGHAFGLEHQSRYDGSGNKLEEYHSGDSLRAPTMGDSYDSQRGLWWVGTSSVSASTIQDDVAVISRTLNGFGYRADDHGNSTNNPSGMSGGGATRTGSGIIERLADEDVFAFATGATTLAISVSGIGAGMTLDAAFELKRPDGSVVIVRDSSTLNESASVDVGPGLYYLVVRGHGDSGDLGQYTATVGNVTATDGADIEVLGAGASITDGDRTPATVDRTDLGLTALGAPTVQVFTLRNTGNQPLNLTGNPRVRIVGSTDFTIIQPTVSVLAPAAATTFSVVFAPTQLGVQNATIVIASNDIDEPSFDFAVRGTGASGKIGVAAGAIPIASGDFTPTDGQSTDFDAADIDGGPVVKTFTLTNTGSLAVTLQSTSLVEIVGLHASEFTLVTPPAGVVPVGGSTTFQIAFDPSVTGRRNAEVHIRSNSDGGSDYAFAITGLGNWAEAEVLGNGKPVLSGDASPRPEDHTDFGTRRVDGDAVTRTFTFRNNGSSRLDLTGAPLVAVGGADASDFVVTRQPDAVLEPGEETSFDVRFDPSARGAREATLTILNTDATEGTYTFAIHGLGIEPEIVLGGGATIADGDATPSLMDGTDFGAGTVGRWVERVFAIQNTGGQPLSLNGFPRVQISGANAGDFSVVQQPVGTVAADGTVTFAVRFEASDVGLRTATVSIASDDADEDPFDFAIQGTGLAAQINLFGGAAHDLAIANGDLVPDAADWTDFGTHHVFGLTVTHTFEITNTGDGVLDLTGESIVIGGVHAGDFTVVNQPDTLLGAGESATFRVEFDSRDVGLRTATVSVLSNDPEDDVYEFAIGGTGVGDAGALGDGVKQVTLNDLQGRPVVFSLRGAGTAQIALAQGGFDVELTGTAANSSLIVTPLGGHEASLHNVTVHGSFGSLIAKASDLTGSAAFAGAVKSVLLDDVADQHLITIGTGGKTSLSFDEVSELSIVSQSPLKSVAATHWTDADGTADKIEAPSLASLTVSGDTARGLRGDFAADVLLSSTAKKALGKVSVAGLVSDAEFRAAGGIGAFVAGALADASVFAGVRAGVVGLPDGSADFNPATITSLTIKGLPELNRSVVNSNIAATDLGKVSLRDLETENNGAAFGIATRRFRSITLVSATGSVKIAPIVGLAGGEADGDPADDFVVKVI